MSIGDRLRDRFPLPSRRNGHDAAAPVPPPREPGGPAPVQAPGYRAGMVVDLERRRDQLVARVAELQWDLGGLAYEMAIRNHVQVDVLVKRAAALQEADAELSEVERIVRMEESGTAGSCTSAVRPTAAAPPSAGSAASPCSSRSRATRSCAA